MRWCARAASLPENVGFHVGHTNVQKPRMVMVDVLLLQVYENAVSYKSHAINPTFIKVAVFSITNYMLQNDHTTNQ